MERWERHSRSVPALPLPKPPSCSLAWPASVGGAPSAARFLTRFHLHQHTEWHLVQRPFEVTLHDAHPARGLGPQTLRAAGRPFPGSTALPLGTAAGQVIVRSSEPVRASLGSRKCFKFGATSFFTGINVLLCVCPGGCLTALFSRN